MQLLIVAEEGFWVGLVCCCWLCVGYVCQ